MLIYQLISNQITFKGKFHEIELKNKEILKLIKPQGLSIILNDKKLMKKK